jgi:hypothetical protein
VLRKLQKCMHMRLKIVCTCSACMRLHFCSIHSACAKTFLAHAQNAPKICLRLLSMRLEKLFKSESEFRSSNISAVTEHTRNINFFGEISNKFFFLLNVHLGPIRWVPKQFFKIWIYYSRNLHFNLGFLSTF